MKTQFLIPLASLVLLAPVAGASAPSDRHPGIYRFRSNLPPECVVREREARPVPRRERLQKLGDLPAAYVILLSDQPSEQRQEPDRESPCALLQRMK